MTTSRASKSMTQPVTKRLGKLRYQIREPSTSCSAPSRSRSATSPKRNALVGQESTQRGTSQPSSSRCAQPVQVCGIWSASFQYTPSNSQRSLRPLAFSGSRYMSRRGAPRWRRRRRGKRVALTADVRNVGDARLGNAATHLLLDLAPELSGQGLLGSIGQPIGTAMLVLAGNLAIHAAVAPGNVNNKCFHS